VDELLTMSNQELTRLEVMQRLKDKRLTQKEAARMLGFSVRQVKRLFRAYQNARSQRVGQRRRGKASNNRLDPQIVQQAIDLI
jgi:transcriptional regulator GlxA family with amidase domain